MRLPEAMTRLIANHVDGMALSTSSERGPFDTGPAAGVRVDQDSVLALSAFWGCVRFISSQIASMPMGVYRSIDGRREEQRDHKVWSVLRDRPSHMHSPYNLKESLVWNALVTGNGYAERYGGSLYILDPTKVSVYLTADRRVLYGYKDPLRNGEERQLLPSEIIHIKGPSRDGIIGLSIISAAAENLSGALATQQFGNAYLGNGTSYGGFIESPNLLADDQFERLRQQIRDDRGVARSGKMKVLEGGLTYKANIPAKDAQLLETRQYGAREICAFFGVPPHKVGIESGATAYASREQAAIEAVVDCLLPWVVRIENEADYKLLTTPERQSGIYTHMNMDVLLRGDAKSRAEANQIRLRNGSLSPNEWAALEDAPPMDGGDTRYITRDLLPLDKAADYAESQMAANEEQEPADEDMRLAALAPLISNARFVIEQREATRGPDADFAASVWKPVRECAEKLGVNIEE